LDLKKKRVNARCFFMNIKSILRNLNSFYALIWKMISSFSYVRIDCFLYCIYLVWNVKIKYTLLQTHSDFFLCFIPKKKRGNNCQTLFDFIYLARFSGTLRWLSSFSICIAAHGHTQHVVTQQSSIKLP